MKLLLIACCLCWTASVLGYAVRQAHVAGYALKDFSTAPEGGLLQQLMRRIVFKHLWRAHVAAGLAFVAAVAVGFMWGRS